MTGHGLDHEHQMRAKRASRPSSTIPSHQTHCGWTLRCKHFAKVICVSGTWPEWVVFQTQNHNIRVGRVEKCQNSLSAANRGVLPLTVWFFSISVAEQPRGVDVFTYQVCSLTLSGVEAASIWKFVIFYENPWFFCDFPRIFMNSRSRNPLIFASQTIENPWKNYKFTLRLIGDHWELDHKLDIWIYLRRELVPAVM